MAGGALVGIDEPAIEQEALHPQRPLLVIGARQINVRRQVLDRRPRHVDVPGPGVAQGTVEREHARLPVAVKDRLVAPPLARAAGRPAAPVMPPVPGPAPGLSKPVPLMPSPG